MKRKTECWRGHEFTAANTYTFLRRDGVTQRNCRKCNALYKRQRLAKRKATT